MKRILELFGFLVLVGCSTVNLNPDKIYVAPLNVVKTIEVKESVSSNLIKLSIIGETSDDVDLYYSVKWFDADDTNIDTLLSKSVWSSVRANVPFHWNVIAPSDKAVKYKIYVSDRIIEQ